MSLNYTPLRHKMLAAIRRGKVSSKPGVGWRFAGVPLSTKAQMSRACADIWDAGLMDPGGMSSISALSGTGVDLLDRWTSQHGEPQ